MGNLPKGYKYQIVGRRARKLGKTSFVGGYDILLYPPSFGGVERRGKYLNMTEVNRTLKIIKKNLKR